MVAGVAREEKKGTLLFCLKGKGKEKNEGGRTQNADEGGEKEKKKRPQERKRGGGDCGERNWRKKEKECFLSSTLQ